MNLAHVIGAFGDVLYGELFDDHLAPDDDLQGVDRRVHRAVASGSRLELLSSDVKPDTRDRPQPLAACHLKVLKFDVMVLRPVRSGKHKEIIVTDLLLLVGQFEELIVKSVKFMAFHLDSKNLKTVFKGSVAASGRKHDVVVVYSHILGVDDLVGADVLEDSVLMDA